MKCEQIEELFPELQDNPDQYPEALQHLETCSSCRTLFHIFNNVTNAVPTPLSESKREASFNMIYKKMHRHNRVVLTRRISSVAAVFLLAIISILNFNNTSSIAKISDDVLFMQSDIAMVPEIIMNDEELIEYLVQYEEIEVLGNLF